VASDQADGLGYALPYVRYNGHFPNGIALQIREQFKHIYNTHPGDSLSGSIPDHNSAPTPTWKTE